MSISNSDITVVDGALSESALYFPPAEAIPPRGRYRSNLKVGLIGGRRLFDLFAPHVNCSIVPHQSESWRELEMLDLLLYDPQPRNFCGGWELSHLSGTEVHRSLILLLSMLKGRVPRVMWFTGDQSEWPAYAHLALNFDAVFVADPRIKDAAITGVLAPCASPTVYHPFRTQTADFSDAKRLMVTGAADLLKTIDFEACQVLRKLGPASAFIIERRFRQYPSTRRTIEDAFPGQYAGYVFEGAYPEVLRQSAGLLTFGPQLEAHIDYHWSAVEALMAHRPVLIYGDCSHPISDHSITSEDVFDFYRSAHTVTHDPHEAEIAGVRGWRTARRDFNVIDRIDAICAALKIEHRISREGKATVIAPTLNEDRADHIVAQYRRQTHPDKELILVLHGASQDAVDRVKARLANQADIRVLFLPSSYSIGDCLNVGSEVGEGSYVMRMTDDDQFLDDYVADLCAGAHAIGADVFGKPFVYFKFDDGVEIYCRERFAKPPRAARPSDLKYGPNGFALAGSTVGGTRSFMKKHRYSGRLVGAADAELLQTLRADAPTNTIIAMLGPSGFIVGRDRTNNRHIWKISTELLERQGRVVTKIASQSEGPE